MYQFFGNLYINTIFSSLALEPHTSKRPIGDQYSDFDKMKKTGIPMPLADRPIIRSMADRHLTLGWKPSIPHGPRFPVTYQVKIVPTCFRILSILGAKP